MPRPVLVVRASIEPSMMEEFERWYRTQHLANVMSIPGIIKAYRCNCHRRGINWSALYVLADESSVRSAIASSQADRARRDWERWLPYVSDLSVEIYAAVTPVATFHH